MIIVVRKQVLAYIPAIYSELCIECKITWHNQGDMELSCENENHHRNGTLHLYSESLFTYFPMSRSRSEVKGKKHKVKTQ